MITNTPSEERKSCLPTQSRDRKKNASTSPAASSLRHSAWVRLKLTIIVSTLHTLLDSSIETVSLISCENPLRATIVERKLHGKSLKIDFFCVSLAIFLSLPALLNVHRSVLGSISVMGGNINRFIDPSMCFSSDGFVKYSKAF
jgi:hypothetical protein